MHADILTDRYNALVCLINCEVQKDCVLCAIAIFRGGISGVIDVFNKEGIKTSIVVPPSVKKSATFCVFTSYEARYTLTVS